LGVEHNLEDRVSGSKGLKKAAFQLMKFCIIKARQFVLDIP